jgi:YD repeat-containing protein
MTDAAGNTRTYTGYTVRGEPTAWTDRSGHQWQQTFDAAGNRLTRTDPLGNERRWRYNGAGEKILQVNRDGGRVEWSYNESGLLKSISGSAVVDRTFSYGPGRKLTQITDADGVSTRLAYDAAGRLAKHVDSSGIARRFNYGAGKEGVEPNRVASVELPRRTIEYRYDKRDRRSAVVVRGDDGSKRVTRYRYNAAVDRTRIERNGTRIKRFD